MSRHLLFYCWISYPAVILLLGCLLLGAGCCCAAVGCAPFVYADQAERVMGAMLFVAMQF